MTMVKERGSSSEINGFSFFLYLFTTILKGPHEEQKILIFALQEAFIKI